jgi:DNA-binding response OmpR family regulator
MPTWDRERHPPSSPATQLPSVVPSSSILILSDQPVVAALLALLVELAGYRAIFAEADERAEDAVQRARPVLVVLVDEALAAAQSDLFFARVTRLGVAVAFFGSPARREAMAAAARARGVPWFELPIGVEELRSVLRAAAGAHEAERSAHDRRQPRTDWTADGTLVYLDRGGRRWYVYDRRALSDRRVQWQRLFVNDAGEVWRYRLHGEQEDEPPPADALERQLAKAERVDGAD